MVKLVLFEEDTWKCHKWVVKFWGTITVPREVYTFEEWVSSVNMALHPYNATYVVENDGYLQFENASDAADFRLTWG